MFSALLHSSVIHGAIPITVEVLCFVALAVVVLTRRPVRPWLLRFAIAAVVGAAIGFGLAWYLGDVKNDFGITLAFSTRAWFATGTGGAAVAGVSLWRARGWRITAGIVSLLLFGMVATVGINATIGEYPTIADALGINKVHPLHVAKPSGRKPVGSQNEPLWQSWHPAADMPAKGKVGTVTIPATASHFTARSAVVYLPPAALASNAPRLPVLIFLGGQPGSPETVLDAGQLPEILNAYATAHDGLAPIVVIPDQLGGDAQNPMCLDSALGNVATYVTVDVPNWIKSHLAVQTGATTWAVGGFSEGGTCSIQLGTKYRSQFGSILDISGQVAPFNGSIDHTIREGFGGSVAAYHAGTAPALLAAGAPFSSTLGIFVVGQGDAKYGPDTAIVEKAAVAAKMNVHPFISPGTAHDWFTEQYGLKVGLPLLGQRWGLQPAS